MKSITEEFIKGAAKEFYNETGRWPTRVSGWYDPLNDTWGNIDAALRYGYRTLPGGSSLSKLIHLTCKPPRSVTPKFNLTYDYIWSLAKEYYVKHEEWPRIDSGIISGGLTWKKIDLAIRQGGHGLPFSKETLCSFLRKRILSMVTNENDHTFL